MASTTRLATIADLQTIEAITDRAYTKYIARIGRKPQPMTTDYRTLIEAKVIWLTEEVDAAVGLIVLQPQVDSLLIYSVAVEPSRQGMGVGRTLLLLAEAEAQRQGYATVQLYTNETMVENIALYRRIGYQETHRTEYRGYDVVYMAKKL